MRLANPEHRLFLISGIRPITQEILMPHHKSLRQRMVDQLAHEAQSGSSRLWGWFGLSYASFLVLPRILMQEMPEDWQKRMAILLEEYDDAYPNHPEIECNVMRRAGNKFIRWPEWLLDYRHPNRKEIKRAGAAINAGS
jgi:hypothetical protein